MSLSRGLMRPVQLNPGLNDVPKTGDLQTSQWMTQVTTILRQGLGQKGLQPDKFVTWRDLDSEGIVEFVPGAGGGSVVPGPGPGPDLTPPPVLENVEVDDGMTQIYISWSDPGLSYYYYIEVHRSATNDLGTAILIGSTNANIYTDVVGSDKSQYYYWVRIIKETQGVTVVGPFNGTSGTEGQAAEDPDWILDQISGKFDTDDLATQVFEVDLFGVKSPDPDVERFAFVVDTTVNPPIVAMDGASIVTASITDAKIKDLVVDKLIGDTASFVEANIADASITNAKIGSFIQSFNYVTGRLGWHLNKSGYFECQNIYARGTIEGSIIRGSVIEGSLLIDSGDDLTVPTEADAGPGSIRFLCSETGAYEKTSTQRFVLQVTLDIDFHSANYTGDGTTQFGNPESSVETVYTGFNRYKVYSISPEVQAILPVNNYSESGGTVAYVYTIRLMIYAVRKSDNVAVLIYNSGSLFTGDKNSPELDVLSRIHVSGVGSCHVLRFNKVFNVYYNGVDYKYLRFELISYSDLPDYPAMPFNYASFSVSDANRYYVSP